MLRMLLLCSGLAALIGCGKKPADELLQKRKLCADVGRYAQTMQFSGLALDQQRPLEPEFAYNPKLDTCFICGGYTDTHLGITTHFLKDSLNNRTIASYKELSADPTQSSAAKKEFEKKKRELMDETAR